MAEDAFEGFRFQVGQMVRHKQMPKGTEMLVLARSISDEGGADRQRWYMLRCFVLEEGRWVESTRQFQEYELVEAPSQESSLLDTLQWCKEQLLKKQDYGNASAVLSVIDKLKAARREKE